MMLRILIATLFWAASTGAALADLDALVERLVTDNGFIGVAAGYANSDEIVDVSVYGKRNYTSEVTVTEDDKWHIGSITKSMTSVLIGQLVDEGLLSLGMTLPEALPQIEMHESWQQVRVRQLLDHEAGLPANFDVSIMQMTDIPVEDRRDARATALADILAQPASTPEFSYSNIGFTLLGHIVETYHDDIWENIITAQLFAPLSLNSAGFGAPLGDQPFGHRKTFGLFINPIDPTNPNSDNTPLIGPAGTVHMSITDLLTYGQELLRISRSADGVISAQTFQTMFVSDQIYRGGLVSEIDSANGETFYWHNGSNTMWHALLIIFPEQNRVFALTTNYFDPKFADVFWEAAREISEFWAL